MSIVSILLSIPLLLLLLPVYVSIFMIEVVMMVITLIVEIFRKFTGLAPLADPGSSQVRTEDDLDRYYKSEQD